MLQNRINNTYYRARTSVAFLEPLNHTLSGMYDQHPRDNSLRQHRLKDQIILKALQISAVYLTMNVEDDNPRSRTTYTDYQSYL